MEVVLWASTGMGMGMGIAGFRRILQGLQNTKFHRGASRLVSRAYFVVPDEQRSSRGRKAFHICPKLAERLFAGSVTASSSNPQLGRSLGSLNCIHTRLWPRNY